MPAAPATTDSWVTASTSRQPLVPSPVTTTPTKRASRSSRISNDTDHPAFVRTSLDPDTGLESSLEFRVGDTVVVNDLAKLKQKFLAPPSYLVPQKKHPRAIKGKGKAKAAAAVQDDDEDDDEDNWRHEDGLRAGDKVAVITRLFEDVRGRKMAMVRWFARPGAVWGEQGPDEDHDEFGEVMPYELYFTSDSTYLQESRLLRQKAAANPFSSPSSSSPTKRRGAASSILPSPSRGSSSSSFLSSAASFRTPLHSDAIPLSTIASSAEVFSPSALADTTITAAHQRPVPMFVCTRVYDVKPVAGAGFWGEVEWDEKRREAVEWYEDRMRDGERDVAQDKWDVEPAMEEDSEDEVDEDEEREKEERRRARAEKVRATQERKARERAQKGGASADESSGDDDGDEDTFANSDASSSSDDDDDDASSSDSDARSSDNDDDDVLRTPTKPKARSARQLPTPASSSASSRRASTVTKAKRARPSTAIADSGRQAKRRRFAAKSRATKGSTTTAAAGSPTSANALPPLLDARELAKLSPFDRAKALLHVSATPESLPCRDEQRERIRQFLGDAILGRTGGCLYVHGVPGTGKTATVHSVVRELQKDEDMDSFTFVEINGMKISEPMAAFSHLWSALAPSSSASPSASTPRKTSPKAALAALEHHFANPDPARPTTVVLVDELDQMLTKRQDVLYNFFNWPHVAHSRLVVVAVANTMDLPERELSGKIRSRLGTNRIPFQPYTWAELKRILEARLALVALPSSSTSTSTTQPPPLFDDVALQKIAKSVAGISGDARKALDVARRTLDRVALRLASSPSAPGASASASTPVRCTIQDATAAYNDMTRTGPATFIRRQSTHAKVLLLAVAQCAKRAGVPDLELDTVLAWHGDFVRQAALVDARALFPASRAELVGVVAGLHAQRLVAAESQRLDVFQRVRACVDEGDLFAALREDEVLKAHVPKVL